MFFKFPIGHLTHPPTSKVFLDFILFTWPLTYVIDVLYSTLSPVADVRCTDVPTSYH